MSLLLGRPCAIQDEEGVYYPYVLPSSPSKRDFRSIDADFPVDCDDEYWEHLDPEHAFVQPPDKPSLFSFFISYLILNRIFALCLHTVVRLPSFPSYHLFTSPPNILSILMRIVQTMVAYRILM
ncbi:hypothetical protein IW261DRAFT_1010989 [Armillaria novae-zelandiae]|uniref:Uncharacterized protein n=1 Tax=Armillaria novae-zelandiae TaxID=153914 RepID=A0AA39TSI6_9AGAR|nr:hypothetical protein IW261DRAFT_1010989 [Armillaria novae-zelandiae]